MHICVGNLAFIGLDNGLPRGQRQAFVWSDGKILLTGL